MQMTVDVLGGIGFEIPVMGLLEQDDDGHDFTGMQLGEAQALAVSQCQEIMVPTWGKLLPEIVYETKQFKYTH